MIKEEKSELRGCLMDFSNRYRLEDREIRVKKNFVVSDSENRI